MLATSTSRTLLDCLPLAVLLLDEQLRVVMANRAAVALFNLPSERLRSAPLAALLPENDLAASLREFHGRTTKLLEASVPKRAGRAALTLKITAVRVAHWAALVDEPSSRPAGKQEFRLLVLENISEKGALEQQLVEAEKRAAIGQLAAGILHEIGNPLASLGSNLLFVRGAIGAAGRPDVMQALDVSLDQLEQMRELLGTLSGIPGRASPRYEITDLHEVVRASVTFIAKEAERRRIHVAVSFHAAPVTCEMDVRLVKQVLLNLFKNAMEAMPNGGRLEIQTSCRPAKSGVPASVAIEIHDSGVGIPEPDLRKVFRPLFSTKARGAGLGLSFCRQAIEDHGGDIRLTSRGADRGTTAIVLLPLRQPASAYE